jgi:hypothetical protein
LCCVNPLPVNTGKNVGSSGSCVWRKLVTLTDGTVTI